MIYTVTLNPALDYVMNTHSLISKDIVRTDSEQLYYGGKGINVSVTLKNLGIDNKALGFLAGFSGKQLEEMLREDNVKCDFIYLPYGYTRINVKIKAEKSIDINAKGPEVSLDDVERLMKKLVKLGKGDTLVLAGSVPSTVRSDIYDKILERLDGREVSFVVDACGDLLLNALKYKPFLIKPNHHELGELFGIDIETVDDVIKYGKKLQELGAKNVLVSRGKDGAVLLDEEGEIHISENAEGKLVSSVGCGDSMVAGFIAGWQEKKSYAYALKLATACANATAFSSSLATKAEIDEIFKKL
ncbi:MAG: 1-phosphofructokinase [Eubacterium sp.]|nr:1-phosphofructokinase [Eubacterium sp.]